jgi:polar amino acid transport system substrate-binding protein
MTDLDGATSKGVNRRAFLLAGSAITASVGLASVSESSAANVETVDFDSSYEGFILDQKIQGDSLTRIQKSGRITIGCSINPPFAYIDQNTGVYSGIDAEIVKYVLKMLKIKEYKVDTLSFDGLIPGLLSQRYDMIGDSLHYTPKRAQVIDFSFPNYFYAEGLLTKKGSPLEHAGSITELSGYTIGSQLGDNYSDWLKAVPGVRYKGYKSWPDLYNDLRAGRIDGLLNDLPILTSFIKDHPEYDLVVGGKYKSAQIKTPANYARHIFRQEDVQLREAWTDAVQWMQQNGKVSEILARYNLAGYSE